MMITNSQQIWLDKVKEEFLKRRRRVRRVRSTKEQTKSELDREKEKRINEDDENKGETRFQRLCLQSIDLIWFFFVWSKRKIENSNESTKLDYAGQSPLSGAQGQASWLVPVAPGAGGGLIRLLDPLLKLYGELPAAFLAAYKLASSWALPMFFLYRIRLLPNQFETWKWKKIE